MSPRAVCVGSRTVCVSHRGSALGIEVSFRSQCRVISKSKFY